MVVQYKEIADIIDEKYTEGTIAGYIKELDLAIEKAKEILWRDNNNIRLEKNKIVFAQVIIDAVEDLRRIQDFHPIENANAIKEAAYFSFWLIKRKPVGFRGDLGTVKGSSDSVINKRKVNYLFINEFCAAIYIMPKIFKLSQPIIGLESLYSDMEKLADDWKKYFDNLIYFLSYRAESPKSIEEALTSLIMTPKWDTHFDFWKVDEKK